MIQYRNKPGILLSCFLFFFAAISATTHVAAFVEEGTQALGARQVTAQEVFLVDYHGEVRLPSDKDDALHFFEQRDVVTRYREVVLNQQVTRDGALSVGDRIYLEFFDDVTHSVVVQRTGVNVNGTQTLLGRVPGEDAYLTLVTTGNRSLGNLFVPATQMFYKIISDPGTHRHYLIEMDERDRDIIESGPPLVPEIREEDIREQQRIKKELKEKNAGPDDWARIGVMVVYTPDAAAWANQSAGGIENVVAAAMANAQLVLDNSEVRIIMHLVHSGMVNYTEGANSGTDLRRFTASDDFNPWGNQYAGFLDEVHEWRDEYGADLSAMFTLVSDVGGLAWLLTNRWGEPRMGFSITRVQQAASGYTHIHEMGHNMGLHHHADQSTQPGPTQWSNWPENSWSAGWRWIGNNDNYYVSVMSYTQGSQYADGTNATQVPYFSNPEIEHLGAPTGHFSFANNALTLKEIKHVIAAYRPSADLAEVFTADATDIMATSAVSGGNITSDGGFPVTARGVVWSKEGNPTVFNNEGMSLDGEGTGEFVSQMDDLHPTSQYYVRAYATTSEGTNYGTLRSFETAVAYRPTISTGEPRLVGHNVAYVNSDLLEDGNVPVLEQGVVWGTMRNPRLLNNDGYTTDEPGVGPFESKITGLDPETTYYYRSYATNIMGTDYGREETFTTLAARIYPNPASDMLWVEFINPGEGEARVFLKSVDGRVVKKRVFNQSGEIQMYLNTGWLSGGVYLLSIQSDYDFPTWPVIIQHQE